MAPRVSKGGGGRPRAASRSKAGARCSSSLRGGQAPAAARSTSRGRSTHDDIVKEIAERAGGLLQSVAPERIEQMARTDVHQGVVAMAPPLRPADLDDLLTVERAFLVAVDGVTDPRNLGAIMRSAETAGATGHRVAPSPGGERHAAVAKAAAGAIEYLPIALVGGIPAAIDRARTRRMLVGRPRRARRPEPLRPRSRRPADRARARRRRHGPRPPHPRSLRRARQIPMHGHVDSLNVAAAATLACHEVARRRRK